MSDTETPKRKRAEGGGRKKLYGEVMEKHCLSMQPHHWRQLSETRAGNNSEAVRYLTDLHFATEWIVEIDSLVHGCQRKPFAKRWQAEKWGEEQAEALEGTQGSIYVCAVVEGRDVMLQEYCLNAVL